MSPTKLEDLTTLSEKDTNIIQQLEIASIFSEGGAQFQAAIQPVLSSIDFSQFQAAIQPDLSSIDLSCLKAAIKSNLDYFFAKNKKILHNPVDTLDTKKQAILDDMIADTSVTNNLSHAELSTNREPSVTNIECNHTTINCTNRKNPHKEKIENFLTTLSIAGSVYLIEKSFEYIEYF